VEQQTAKLSEIGSLVLCVATTLVDVPEQVSVTEVQGENTLVLELRVANSDVGKIIGKQGRMANAIRTILSGVSMKFKRRTVLEIIG
jgi:predicted RNA-binding protein YlqC (UPF0109 family)